METSKRETSLPHAEVLDQWLPLADVPEVLPRRSRGRKVHVATVYRWTTEGVAGVVLKSADFGGQRCTTRHWLAEWAEAVAAARGRGGPPKKAGRRKKATQAVLSRHGLA